MDDERPYGERFLDAFKRNGGSLATWDWATIQEMKRSDREGFVRVLRERMSTLPYAMIQRIRAEEPESLARAVIDGQRAQGAAVAATMMWFPIIT